MSNIRVDLDYTIKDGTEIKFRSPVDCSQITGLIVYYPGAGGNTTSKEFVLADAHGNNVGDIDHLFAEDVVVKVILDVTKSMAFVQNADTNAYLEEQLASKLPTSGGTLTGELRVNKDTTNGIRMWADNEGGNIRIYPPASNTASDYWDIDCHDGGMRIFAYKKSTNVNGGPGNVFPLTLGTDGSIKVGNTAKTRANLGVVPGAESTASPNCYYRTVDGVTEWINPPMAAGTEYRTTERFKGKVVYTKLINYGKLAAANTTVTISLGCTATNLVDFNILTTLSSGTQYSFPAFNFSSAAAMLTGYFADTKNAFVVRCHTDLSAATAVVTVKYTKD